MRTPTSSGASAAAAATSASSPRSSTGFTRWGRSCSPDRSSIRSRMPARCSRFYREFIAAAPDELTTIFDLRVAPAAALPARGRARQADRDGRGLLRRRARGRDRGGAAAEGVRHPDRRPARAEAVHRAAVDVRPVRPARLALLLEVGRAAAAHRRRRSTRSSSTPRRSPRRSRTASSSSSAAPSPAWERTRPPSASATPPTT